MIRRALVLSLVGAVFVVPSAQARPLRHGKPTVVADKPGDDDEDDDNDGTDADEEAKAKAKAAEESDDDDRDGEDPADSQEGENGEPPRTSHDTMHPSDAEDEDEGQGEDPDEHRHHGHTHHEPGLGLEWIASRARLRLGLVVQPMARYGHDSIPSADTMDLTIRRARVSFDAEVSHGTGFHLELQAKNLQVGFADLYGRWALEIGRAHV